MFFGSHFVYKMMQKLFFDSLKNTQNSPKKCYFGCFKDCMHAQIYANNLNFMYFSAMHKFVTVQCGHFHCVQNPQIRPSVHSTVHPIMCTKVGHVGYHWKALAMSYSYMVNLVHFCTWINSPESVHARYFEKSTQTMEHILVFSDFFHIQIIFPYKLISNPNPTYYKF